MGAVGGVEADETARGDCDSLKLVNSCLLASSFRARAAAVSNVKPEPLEALWLLFRLVLFVPLGVLEEELWLFAPPPAE